MNPERPSEYHSEFKAIFSGNNPEKSGNVEISDDYKAEFEMNKSRILALFDERADKIQAAATNNQLKNTMFFRGNIEELSSKNTLALEKTRKKIAGGDLDAGKSFLLNQKKLLKKDIECQENMPPIPSLQINKKIDLEIEKTKEKLAEVESLLAVLGE